MSSRITQRKSRSKIISAIVRLWGGLVKPEKSGWVIQTDYLTRKAAKNEEDPAGTDYFDKNWLDFSI